MSDQFEPSVKRVPLEPGDIEPGMVFTNIPAIPGNGFSLPSRVAINGILFIRDRQGSILVGWEELMKYWMWSFDGREWMPCLKFEVIK